MTARCTCGYSGPDFDCPAHGPCQGCHAVTGRMTPCDGSCDGLTAENEEQMRVDWRRRAKQRLEAVARSSPSMSVVTGRDVRDALVEALRLLTLAEEERDLAVAHDRQPYPTAFAYERVCAALLERAEERRQAVNALSLLVPSATHDGTLGHAVRLVAEEIERLRGAAARRV